MLIIFSIIFSNFSLLPFLCLIKSDFPAWTKFIVVLPFIICVHSVAPIDFFNHQSNRPCLFSPLQCLNLTFAFFSTFAICACFFVCNRRQLKIPSKSASNIPMHCRSKLKVIQVFSNDAFMCR